MPNLKDDHSYLYKRVRLKAILHIALGLVLILLPSAVPSHTATTRPPTGASAFVNHALTYFGVAYLIVGLLIVIGIYTSSRTYKFLRQAMTIAALYNSFWLVILLIIAWQTHLDRGIAYITVIYSYMTYNIWYVRNDPGWNAIKLIKQNEVRLLVERKTHDRRVKTASS